MATVPNITFGNKSVSANYISNPQTYQTGSPPNQKYVSNNYDKADLKKYQYSANQVIVGQPSQIAGPPPLYDYRSTNVDPRTSTNVYGAKINEKANLTGTVNQSIKEPALIKEVQKQKYSKINSQPSAYGGSQQPLCSTCCWVAGILIGLALIVLILLFGLGVIGGPINNNSVVPQNASPLQALQPATNLATSNSTPQSTGANGSTSVSPLPSSSTSNVAPSQPSLNKS